jgi:hypothetical protein
MNAGGPITTTVRGYRAVSAAERAGFGMLTAYAAAIGSSRAVNYGRERNRRMPRVRSWARRAHHAPGRGDQLRIHHFLPGIGLAFLAGGAAILTHGDGGELWLGIPFGTGTGLALDEVGLLVSADNPYWRSESLALAQSAAAALGAAALAIRFHRRGAALPSEP